VPMDLAYECGRVCRLVVVHAVAVATAHCVHRRILDPLPSVIPCSSCRRHCILVRTWVVEQIKRHPNVEKE
jgi:hypothetical protein